MIKSWEEMMQAFRSIIFMDKFDTIIAIANGGIIPAALLQQRLQLPMFLLKLNYRNAQQQVIYDEPKLLEPLSFDPSGRHILLVEDRIKTGASLKYGLRLLKKAALVKTFAVNGNADYHLYDEECFRFPWNL